MKIHQFSETRQKHTATILAEIVAVFFLALFLGLLSTIWFGNFCFGFEPRWSDVVVMVKGWMG